jgi:hypothetical protein
VRSQKTSCARDQHPQLTLACVCPSLTNCENTERMRVA